MIINDMRVSVSVGGKFHLFDLAQQLERAGCLEQLITSYPKFSVESYGIPKSKVRSIIFKEVFQRGWGKVPPYIRRLYDPQYLIHETFDHVASRLIAPCDIAVGLSSFSRRTLACAKARGAATVLECGSSHMLYQNEILAQEYKLFGARGDTIHPRVLEKGLAEYQETDYIAVPSTFVRRTFVERGIPEGKMIQVPYGVDLSQFRQIPKTDDVFRVVFVGTMSLRKGIQYLMRAFAQLRLPNSELVLIGSPSPETAPLFEQYAGSYRYLNHIPFDQLYRYYSQGSVFAMMSLEEGLARVQPQAMACGLPVICTTNTGGEDMVRDGVDGFVIGIRDVDALKEKLTYLYEHPEVAERMGKSAKERVSSGFTWDDYGKRMISEYRRICPNF